MDWFMFTYLERSLESQTFTLKGPITSLFRNSAAEGNDWSETNNLHAIVGIISLLQNIIIYHNWVLSAVKQSTQATFMVKTETNFV